MYCKETFDYALKLFKEKWRGKETPSIDDFLDYFEKVWIRETINPLTGKKLAITNGMKAHTVLVNHQVITDLKVLTELLKISLL